MSAFKLLVNGFCFMVLILLRALLATLSVLGVNNEIIYILTELLLNMTMDASNIYLLTLVSLNFQLHGTLKSGLCCPNPTVCPSNVLTFIKPFY